jgi:hypothetical protein
VQNTFFPEAPEELVEFFKLKISAKGHFIFDKDCRKTNIPRAGDALVGLGCHKGMDSSSSKGST